MSTLKLLTSGGKRKRKTRKGRKKRKKNTRRKKGGKLMSSIEGQKSTKVTVPMAGQLARRSESSMKKFYFIFMLY